MSIYSKILNGETEIVGIKDGVHTSTPLSGLFINSLAGMSLRTFAAAADAEYASGYNLAKEKIKDAAAYVFSSIRDELLPEIMTNQMLSGGNTAVFDYENTIRWDTGGPLNGLRYEVIGSAFLRLRVTKIEILLSSAVSGLAITITDGFSTQTLTRDVVANTVLEIPIDFMTFGRTLDITFDATGLSGARGQIPGGCCGKVSKYIRTYATKNGALSKQSCGINAYVTAECSVDIIFDTLLPRFYVPIWLRSGIEIFREIEASQRLNPIIAIDRKKAPELRDELEFEYEKKMAAMKSGALTYLSKINDPCFICRRATGAHILP